MYRNYPNQHVELLAINTLTNTPQAGDAANILGFIKKDTGGVLALNTPVPTEVDALNCKGMYDFPLTQAESNADLLLFSGKSITPNVVVVPLVIYTLPIALASLGTGFGARTILVTVNDGATPIQGAMVRMSTGAVSYYGVTDLAGQITFNLDDATWTVAITKPSAYSFAGATLVVTADASPVYSMSIITLLPSTVPGSTTGQAVVYDINGGFAANVEVTCIASALLKTETGVIHDTHPRVSISDVNGVVQFPNLVKGMSYDFQPPRAAQARTIEIPLTAGVSYQLPSMLN